MKANQLFAPTLREIPAEAEIASHQLMLKAGLIQKLAAGVYSYLPVSWRVMKKISEIIREEMDAIDGQELMMPIVHPAEIWQQSGRWDVYGAELWRVKDRHGRDFCLAPTHEEIITDLVKDSIRSYKQLPQRLYQIQTKFRDERRPRFGLMRSREFVMKDMYSFDKDEEGLEVSYRLAYGAYEKIFGRCGLNCRPVEADSGAIGGSGSHEFMALADTGEADILYCEACDYAASTEIASVAALPEADPQTPAELFLKETPNCPTIEDVCRFLNLDIKKSIKAMCYAADGKLVIVFLRGDRRVNEVKLKNSLHCLELEFAPEELLRVGGLVPGYIGAIDIKGISVIADCEVPFISNQVIGGGKHGTHYVNANYGRDYTVETIADIRMVEEGECCPKCGAPLRKARGIEVGQVFKLHTKYSHSMEARFHDIDGQEKEFVMGCYGIGVGRTMAAVIEQNHDEKGIIWPVSIAPYQVVVIPVNDKDQELVQIAQDIYVGLQKKQIETVLDDRKERPGVKFNDADLLGYPLRITIGTKCKETGNAEVKVRSTGEQFDIPLQETVDYVTNWLIKNK